MTYSRKFMRRRSWGREGYLPSNPFRDEIGIVTTNAGMAGTHLEIIMSSILICFGP
jgi:hypothetical protein